MNKREEGRKIRSRGPLCHTGCKSQATGKDKEASGAALATGARLSAPRLCCRSFRASLPAPCGSPQVTLTPRTFLVGTGCLPQCGQVTFTICALGFSAR